MLFYVHFNALLDTFVSFSGDYDVVDKLDPEEVAGFAQSFCNLPVGARWLQAPTRMIVRHDYTRRPVGDCIGKHLARVDEAGRERADGDDALGYEAVCAVESQTYEVLLLFVADIR